MAANRLQINGLDELRAALRAAPAELVRESAAIVLARAEAARDAMAALYPVRDYGRLSGRGNLQKGLRVDTSSDFASASALVRNTAKHAYIFENGTSPRRWANGKSTGSMAPGRVFIPTAIKHRRAMVAELIALVRSAGFEVSGSAE